ncbi:MAG: EAL domain-containing response regulator [Rubrivivax sp.]|nr:EAL domain-containing response regulator [Rubrivivax sp.]
MNTLLIDDDPLALKLLTRQLGRVGCVGVLHCERAEEAMTLLKARSEAIGLVFCDLQMPDIDGVEFVRHLAGIGYSGSLVLVSGEDGRILKAVAKLAQAHRIHVLGMLQKPIKNEQLSEVLASHAARKAVPRRAAQGAFEPADLERAIAGDELIIHYQPKVALASGALIGVESLVRWNHPQAGLVYPDRFITLAEDHGLIDALTVAVLAAALRQSRRWRDAGLDLQVAVNVSMDNLAALDLPDSVAQLASEIGVEPSRLVLEVTESRLMRDVRAPLDVLTRLRLKGVSLSIDDFGTGHSSLAQLRDIPFDELKLDRSFVHGAAGDTSLGAIIEATLAMARQLGMKTVAEGVEDQADLDYLRAHGCDVAQGYFIARPMPGADLVGWRVAWESRRREWMATAA